MMNKLIAFLSIVLTAMATVTLFLFLAWAIKMLIIGLV